MYVYYQIVGGHEPWLTQKVGLEFSEPLPTFVTVLATDIIINDSVPKDAVEKVRYMGDFYCDLDAADIEESIKGGQALYSKFQEYGLQEGDVRIFLSGKKGLHFLVPQQVFMDRVSPLQKLPAIYKEVAFTLAVDTMDFRVYTAKRGRMLRTCYNVRENGNYKVPITAQELKDLTAESYDRLCKAPRSVSVGEPKYRAKFAILFDTARQKVTRVKERKSKPVDAAALRRHMPTIQKILDGKASPDAGFNKIAMQLALYARDSGISPEQLVKDADGLLQHHQSDGYRYNTYAKRRHELVRMCEYVDDNPSYDFAIEPFLSLLPKSEAGDTKNAVHGGDSDDEGQVAHGGVVQRDGAYWALGGDAGDKLVLGAYFSNATVLHDRTHGSISCLMTEIVTPSGPKPVSVERADFASSSSLHKLCSAYGVSFMGSDIHARGIYELMLKSIEPNVYVTESEGLDVINIPSSQFELARKPFLIWADGKGVRVPQEIADLGIQIKFQGYPDPAGVIKTDLTNAPPMRQWLEEEDNRERMGRTLQSLFKCFPPDVIGKTVGWMVACFWRQLFHEGYGKFPIMHVNGVAGAGKCLGYGTPVIMHDGTIKPVQDIVAGDKLLGPDGGVRNVLITTRGREMLYKVTPLKGDPYIVNESHILSLKKSDRGTLRLTTQTVASDADIVNVSVKTVFDSERRYSSKLKGWRPEALEFPVPKEDLPVDPYWLGLWLGDGRSNDVAIYKPEGPASEWLRGYAERLGLTLRAYDYGSSGCPGWAIVGDYKEGGNPLRTFLRTWNLIDNKHIPAAYRTASIADRRRLIAGLLDSDGHLTNGGYDWISKDEALANDFMFICRSVGLAAYMKPCEKGIKSTGYSGTYYRVSVSGHCDQLPCLAKKAPPRLQVKRHLVTGITVEKLDVGDYYGFQLDGDSLFLLGDFTVTHNSEYTTSLLHFFYYNQEPRVLTPSSTPYSILATISGSASIPIVVDEYKPNEMPREIHHRLKLMFRDAYNKRETSRGGGNRTKDNYNALSVVQLSAPIAFVAEAMETETALLERSVIVTIKRQPTKVTTRTYRLFKEFYDNREVLGMIGHHVAARVARTWTVDKLREEFDTIYNSARNEFLLQPGDEAILTEEEIMKKSNMKERVVYNLSVASFGLSKLEQLLRAAFPNYSELFGEVMPTLHDGVFSRLDDSARNTLPEYLKVLLSMSDMTQLANDHPYVLVDGVEFVITEEGGFQTLNIVARMAYAKYRAWYRSQGQQPLFTNEDAFVHSLKDAPQFLRLGYGTAVLRTESVLLDYTALLRAGIPAYKGKPRAKI